MSNKLTKEDVAERRRFTAYMEREKWIYNHHTDVWIKRPEGETLVVSDWQAYQDWQQREGVIGGR